MNSLFTLLADVPPPGPIEEVSGGWLTVGTLIGIGVVLVVGIAGLVAFFLRKPKS